VKMSNLDDLTTAFSAYGYLIKLDVNVETIPLGGFGVNTMAVYGKQDITAEMRFYGRQGLYDFRDDMLKCQQLKEEEKIRANNPSVQRAWEEYQLLLKLSK